MRYIVYECDGCGKKEQVAFTWPEIKTPSPQGWRSRMRRVKIGKAVEERFLFVCSSDCEATADKAHPDASPPWSQVD